MKKKIVPKIASSKNGIKKAAPKKAAQKKASGLTTHNPRGKFPIVKPKNPKK